MTVTVVFRHDDTVHVGYLAAFLQIQPHGHLAAVERWLLDDGYGTVRFLLHQRLLVGRIAEKVSLQDDVGTHDLRQPQQPFLSFVNSFELSVEEFGSRLHMQHDVELFYLILWGKGGYFCRYTQIFPKNFAFIHVVPILWRLR